MNKIVFTGKKLWLYHFYGLYILFQKSHLGKGSDSEFSCDSSPSDVSDSEEDKSPHKQKVFLFIISLKTLRRG